MSIVGQKEPSGISYPTLYMGKKTSNGTNVSNQMYEPDNLFSYGPVSYLAGIANQKFLSSSTQQAELCSSIPEVSGSLYTHVSSPTVQLLDGSTSSSNLLSEYSACLPSIAHSLSSLDSPFSRNSETISCSLNSEHDMSYDEVVIRSRLEELEKVLLNDTEMDFLDDIDENGIHDEWDKPVENLLLSNSPGESSSESNASTVDSSREGKTPKQLLFDCAAAISEGSFEEATAIITNLRQIVSIQGDPSQRLAAYLVEGLDARISCSGKGIYKALRCKEPPTWDRLSAMQTLFEVCPCFKFGFMSANGAISEVFNDYEKVHIIDFDINQGSQYISLLQTLAKFNKKARLRITGVDDPESVQREIGGLKVIGQRLEKLAEVLGITFEFCAISANTADVTPFMLGCLPDEALVVNFAYQLHHLPDESVSTVNQRDWLLRMVKGLGPKLVTVIEQDVNTNTAPFFPRFVEVYNYYHAVFESLDATLPRDSPDRMNVERHCLAKDMVNIVACEGTDRIERYEAAGKWRARMIMAGYSSCPLSSFVKEEIRAENKLYCDRYQLKEEAGALYFGWEDKTLVVVSAWR